MNTATGVIHQNKGAAKAIKREQRADSRRRRVQRVRKLRRAPVRSE